MYTVLVAEDECEIRNYLKLALTVYGLHVECAQTGEEVVSLVRENPARYSLLLLDVFMPVRDGIDTLKTIRELTPDVPVVMMSAAATPRDVVAAMTEGAKDFVSKPIAHDELRRAIEKALDIALPLKPAENSSADGSTSERPLAVSGAWSQRITALLERIGSSDVPVLLHGETGVGKEVIARSLHARSRRASRPFLKLNCAALPSELVESELFGYEKGAFTGAFKSTPGKFEMAKGGTILLDEIGDMDVKLQAKLLQVLQDREFHRLGAKETSRVDVRVMAASHCDFDKAIREGRFREDLYYRLNIIDIQIPPLRERRDEILPLAEFFINKYANADAPALDMPGMLKQVFLEHTWPGNVRELENVVQKYLVLRNPGALAEEIRQRARKGTHAVIAAAQVTNTVVLPEQSWPDMVPDKVRPISRREAPFRSIEADNIAPVRVPDTVLSPARPLAIPDVMQGADMVPALSKVRDEHRAAETEAIIAALNSSFWNRKQAASLLNIDYKALLYKMKKLGIGEKSAVAG
ncbi:MAG: sigma-54-dependent Fis family transcriptional regulator [Acidobacteriaceae bacterium]|nr:sigma-54-dependent Fis family transcriptional regulator [Acidobacteriaceae bacterium]